jgi:hypothetical protein
MWYHAEEPVASIFRVEVCAESEKVVQLYADFPQPDIQSALGKRPFVELVFVLLLFTPIGLLRAYVPLSLYLYNFH